MKKTIFSTVLCCAVTFSLLVASPVFGLSRTDNTTVELISEVTSVSPGESFDIALRLEPDPGWHLYWINPGDAGKAPSIDWELPEGFQAGELQFPRPNFVPFGDLMSYGYDATTLFIAEIQAPDAFGDQVRIAGTASWLVCDDSICIPERAGIELELPSGDGGTYSIWRSEFAEMRAEHPIPLDWNASFSATEETVVFDIEVPPDFPELHDLWLFPVATKLIEHAYPQTISKAPGHIRFETTAGPRFDKYDSTLLVLTTTGSDTSGARVQSFEINATSTPNLSQVAFDEVVEKSIDTTAAGSHAPSEPISTDSGGFNPLEILKFLGLAILGGLILNAMPCVLPILSLKALSVAELAGKDTKIARRSGMAYTIGVLVCFALLGSVMLLLRAGGSYVGWAFHLQNPTMIAVLALLMVAVGFNFSGVFEIRGTFANLGGLTDRLTRTQGTDFFTGFLAVIIASPCTVPFMGVALGYALVQPILLAQVIFLGLGVGFALPYLLVTFFPTVRRFLPRPGAWMESMRRLLAFPMYGTAIWLIWVLGQQAGINTATFVLVLCLLLGFSLWSWTRARESTSKAWWITSGVGVILLVAVGWMLPTQVSLYEPPSSNTSAQTNEVNWSEAELSKFHSDNKAVFAYFTADWCITCKVNERVALRSEKVQNYFQDKDIQVLVGDWTTENPEITAELKQHGRAGVPLYLYYKPNGNIENPVILPALLTPDLVIDIIRDA